MFINNKHVFVTMIDKKDFRELQSGYALSEDLRDKIIKKSRDVIKLSKMVIYAVHRNELKQASDHLKQLEKAKKDMESLAHSNPQLTTVGAFEVALQEYVEAVLYFDFVQNAKITPNKKLKVTVNAYLGGLADLTGELLRRAVFLAGKYDSKKVIQIRDLADEIYGEMLKFDIRGGEIRKKFDSIKYNLKNLEDLVLQLKMKR